MKKIGYFLGLLAMCVLPLLGQTHEKASFIGAPTYVLPTSISGVRNPVISLNGKWDFKFSAKSKWCQVQVPGELAMQGYAIEHDKAFWLRKSIVVPADYADKRVILRFDGVYSHARLSVNGKPVRQHSGGFTRWETDITQFVRIGAKNTIVLEVTDRIDDISYASGYAHHPIGGILRDVTLFAQPKQPICDLHIEALLDSVYRDANLNLSCRSEALSGAQLRLQLIDPEGRNVSLPTDLFGLRHGDNTISLSISTPIKWDAEHPNLYTLKATLLQEGKPTQQLVRKVGFREVKIVGNRMMVNGKPVKLRGACRHDVSPTMGRSTTAQIDSLDALLFKRANMNFVRTSHYPPTERFLDFCDRYGIYVESETAVCFVDTYRQQNYAPGNTQSDTAYSANYLSQCQEMVKNFRSHPSVLFWSIGNESAYGTNFQQCWDWVKSTDATRPVIFSYPGSAVENKAKIFDILSMHYQDVDGNLDQWGMSTRRFQGHGMPVLFDEWAHPACYTYATLQTDPNIREFWGKSIDLMWSGLFDAPGGLGGAIWGYVDDVFSLPKPKVGTAYWKEFAHTAKPADYQGDCVGYGEWGIVDVWRREKPEFWSTKKAYSPIRLMADRNIGSYVAGQPLTMTIYNRFDHTDLSELNACYTYNNVTKPLPLDSLAPHHKGVLAIPATQWQEGHKLQVKFYATNGELIDSYEFVLGQEHTDYPSLIDGNSLTIVDLDTMVIVRGRGFEIPFSKATGLIQNARVGNEVLVERGPMLNIYVNYNHLTGAEVRRMANHFVTTADGWQKSSMNYYQEGDNVVVLLSGTQQGIGVDYRMMITPKGELSVDYQTHGVPNGYLRETGLTFQLADGFDHLSWKRRGYWDSYPQGAFAGNEGATPLFKSNQAKYGQRPTQPWQADTHNYYYWADAGANCKTPLTQMAKGMKENIYYYTISTPHNHSLSVVSTDGGVGCRMNKTATDQLMLYTDNRWDYPEIAWGNYCKTLEATPCYGQINIRIK